MTRYVLRRLLLAIPVADRHHDGGVRHAAVDSRRSGARAGRRQSERRAQIERIREEFGLNRPLPVQYAYFLKSAVTLDFGDSLRTNQPVAGELRQFFGATIELSVAALIIALVVGIPRGRHRGDPSRHVARLRHDDRRPARHQHAGLLGRHRADLSAQLPARHLSRSAASSAPASSLDHITYAYVLDSLLTGNWPAFRSSLHHLLLPAFVLSTIPMAIIARMTRSSMLEVLGQDYLRTARAKGCEDRLVVARHALKNALIPVVTAIGLQFGGLLSGAFLTETVFGRPGLGRYVVAAIGARDYPAIQGTVLVVAVVVRPDQPAGRCGLRRHRPAHPLRLAQTAGPGTPSRGSLSRRDSRARNHGMASTPTSEPAPPGASPAPPPRNPPCWRRTCSTRAASAGLWRDAGRRLARDKAAMAGLLVVVLLVVVALPGPADRALPPQRSVVPDQAGTAERRASGWGPMSLAATSSAAS